MPATLLTGERQLTTLFTSPMRKFCRPWAIRFVARLKTGSPQKRCCKRYPRLDIPRSLPIEITTGSPQKRPCKRYQRLHFLSSLPARFTTPSPQITMGECQTILPDLSLATVLTWVRFSLWSHRIFLEAPHLVHKVNTTKQYAEMPLNMCKYVVMRRYRSCTNSSSRA